MNHVLRIQVSEIAIAGGIAVLVLIAVYLFGSRRGADSLRQRLIALGSRLGGENFIDEPHDIESSLTYVEQTADQAAEAISNASADAIRLRKALDTLPQAVIVRDEHGEQVFRNLRAIELMSNRHGDSLAIQAVNELLESTSIGSAEERTLELYGPPRRTLVVSTRSIDNGQRTLGVTAVIEDVSERRRLEEVRRDFIANVSHEMKTPMGALGLLAETLLDETEPAVSRRLAERIHTEAFRISRVIDDLLDLSRIESEATPPREPVLVNLVMAEAAEREREAAAQRGVSIELTEPSPPLAILGDRRQLTSAVFNLLDNAVKFSYPNSSVHCRATLGDQQVVISVQDSGVGIPTRDLERIFERFYRVDPGRSRSTGGTGLGLSIVRHVAHNHHGRVEVDSREGEGTTFSLILPMQNAPETD
ncbi:MAG TPA: ATP-binding protein [Acidimicrobiales bacterium]|nr:ATP-binding protein [Acidimicrobiales bacterium]